ncbi:membrane-bound alkaline phosphatase-like [Epargyreus clarus]|uniref:membrane-bound alkaline phosphatase-like n=1 Tax=Epargyreus clarus TaxID=520877 RepID=UPI003C2FA39D
MSLYHLILNAVVLLCIVGTSGQNVNTLNNINASPVAADENNPNYWIQQAQFTLRSKLAPLNTRVAKNVIFFVGDGMSITTLAATRAYLGQKYGLTGEEVTLSFETFPFTGLAKTYCVNENVADSACSGTAYLSGVKNNVGTLGVSAAVAHRDCYAQLNRNNTFTGIMDWAQKAGKATGLVTNMRVTHATPAAAYANSANRHWEADLDQPEDALRCDDIAKQLVRGEVGSKINVILGGGRGNFFSKHERDAEDERGHREDGVDLIREWIFRKERMGGKPTYVYKRNDLLMINEKDYDNVLGLFTRSHMPNNYDTPRDKPSLSEMTQKAIQILSQNRNGYFLFVEGGRIDLAHHASRAHIALDETAELARAVEAAMRMVNLEETLIVVTADHSHTMTYSGHSRRGADILGVADLKHATDHLRFTILSYANGPGFKPTSHDHRHNLKYDDIGDMKYRYPSMVPTHRELHAGDDVAVFAKGPWAHLFSGNYEQNYIPHAIAYAACMGPGLTICK